MIFSVRLTPNASEDRIIGMDTEGTLKIKVRAKPVEGQANEALVALLAKQWKLPKSRINIKKGDTSRNKLVEIEGLSDLKGLLP